MFPAEKMSSQHNNYHKKCFTCRDCNRPLDPFLACDTPDMEIVCRWGTAGSQLYTRLFVGIATPRATASPLSGARCPEETP